MSSVNPQRKVALLWCTLPLSERWCCPEPSLSGQCLNTLQKSSRKYLNEESGLSYDSHTAVAHCNALPARKEINSATFSVSVILVWLVKNRELWIALVFVWANNAVVSGSRDWFLGWGLSGMGEVRQVTHFSNSSRRWWCSLRSQSGCWETELSYEL